MAFATVTVDVTPAFREWARDLIALLERVRREDKRKLYRRGSRLRHKGGIARRKGR